MPRGYIALNLRSGEAYVKEGRLRDIKAIDAIIFDCDGVLIDIRESYNRAVSKTATYLFNALTGQSIPEDFFSDETIFLFKRSGGFNNDWDLTYGSIIFLLSELPGELLAKIVENIKALMGERSAVKRIMALKGAICAGFGGIEIDPSRLAVKIREFTGMLDESGLASIDRAMLSSNKIPGELYNLIKSFLYGSKRVGESIIVTLFEEIFCGPKLFEEMYKVSPGIYNGRGMIENGRVIIKPEALKYLSSLIGGQKFGVASGSKFKPAKYILGDILDMFNPRAQIFLDNIEAIESKYLEAGIDINLKKPNPYSLFKSSWSLEPFRRALFIGDLMEDVIAVERANRLDPRFISAGVYQYTGVRDEVLGEFLRLGCDIIAPSVNEIPMVIETVREGLI